MSARFRGGLNSLQLSTGQVSKIEQAAFWRKPGLSALCPFRSWPTRRRRLRRRRCARFRELVASGSDQGQLPCLSRSRIRGPDGYPRFGSKVHDLLTKVPFFAESCDFPLKLLSRLSGGGRGRAGAASGAFGESPGGTDFGGEATLGVRPLFVESFFSCSRCAHAVLRCASLCFAAASCLSTPSGGQGPNL